MRTFLVLILLAMSLFACVGAPETPDTNEPPKINEPPEASPISAEPESVPPEEVRPAFTGTYGFPEGMAFIEETPPDSNLAPGVGVLEPGDEVARLSAPEKRRITEIFERRYRDSILSGLPITGVLGGDRVHAWPPVNSQGYVQNWRISSGEANSWGIPALILCVLPQGSSRAYTISGKILDRYGKNRGIGGNNGAAGYGAPRGSAFYYRGGIAQWFGQGLMWITEEGDLFIPEGTSGTDNPAPSDSPVETAPAPITPLSDPDAENSSAASPIKPPPEASASTFLAQFPRAETPPLVGMGEESLPEEIQEAFRTAWREGVERSVISGRILNPDSPVAYADLREEPLTFRSYPIEGMYHQSFNDGADVIVLPVSSALPLSARLLSYPFLDVIMTARRRPIKGAESLDADDFRAANTGRLAERLLDGFAQYGSPLSDPLPRIIDGKITLSQRFSKGWMIHQE